MGVFFVIGLIVLILAILLIVKLIKKMLAMIILIAFVVIILLGVMGFALYNDVIKLRESQHLFLLDVDDELVAGFEWVIAGEKDPVMLDSGELAVLNTHYAEKDYKEMLGDDNYRAMIFEEQAFDFIGIVEQEQGDTYPKEFVDEVLASDDPVEVIVDYQMEKEDIPETMREAARAEVISQVGEDIGIIKGNFFGMLINTAGEREGVRFMFKIYKEKKMTVYPETIIFDAIKIMPLSLAEKFIGVD